MAEQLLGDFFGDQDDGDDDRRREHARDFVSRYEQGAPDEGYTTAEALHNYRRVAERASPLDYEAAAAEAFQRMSPQERTQLGQLMEQRGDARFGGPTDNPRILARAAAQYRQQASGGGLAALFGTGNGAAAGEPMGHPLAKVALGGIAAMAMKRMLAR
jgi:hypothetical protein